MEPCNFPTNAVKISYKPRVGCRINIYIWQFQGKYAWYSLGNEGTEPTEREAIEAAKRWTTTGEYRKESA